MCKAHPQFSQKMGGNTLEVYRLPKSRHFWNKENNKGKTNHNQEEAMFGTIPNVS
jgi:hypothetical protein